MPEIIRLEKALQTTASAKWQPGDKVVVPPPKTAAEMEKRPAEGYGCKDWYLCFNKFYVYSVFF